MSVNDSLTSVPVDEPTRSRGRHAVRRLLTSGAGLVLLAVSLTGVVRSAEAVVDLGTAESFALLSGSMPTVLLFSLLLTLATIGLLVAAVPRRPVTESRNR